MRHFLYKLREDIRSAFGYPDVSLEAHPKVDYDYYWDKRGRKGTSVLSEWQRERVEYVARFIKAGDTILDIGCGDGAVLKYLMDKTGAKGIGADFSDTVLDAAQKLGIETVKLDLRDEASIASLPHADHIIGFEILEHVPEPETIVLALEKRASKNMFFSFPNTGYYAYRLRLLWGKFPLQWVVHPAEHVRFWTAVDARWWAASLGLHLKRLHIYQGLPVLNKIAPSLFGRGLLLHVTPRRS